MGSVSNQQFAGGCVKAQEEAPEDAARAAEEPQLLHGAGICKWFNVRMGFGFLSMTARAGVALDPPVDVFVHQVRAILVTLQQERDVGARIRGWADGLGCWIEGRSRALIVRSRLCRGTPVLSPY